MTRRQFIVACLVLTAAWLTGLRKLEFRRLFAQAMAAPPTVFPTLTELHRKVCKDLAAAARWNAEWTT